jgi:hypothetical protein
LQNYKRDKAGLTREEEGETRLAFLLSTQSNPRIEQLLIGFILRLKSKDSNPKLKIRIFLSPTKFVKRFQSSNQDLRI